MTKKKKPYQAKKFDYDAAEYKLVEPCAMTHKIVNLKGKSKREKKTDAVIQYWN